MVSRIVFPLKKGFLRHLPDYFEEKTGKQEVYPA